jgi:hypothetical protein
MDSMLICRKSVAGEGFAAIYMGAGLAEQTA